MEINKASKDELLRIPGIGVRGVFKILKARRFKSLDFGDLRKLKISLKRARYFITCKGKYQKDTPLEQDRIKTALLSSKINTKVNQPSLFDLQYSSITGEL